MKLQFSTTYLKYINFKCNIELHANYNQVLVP